MLLLFTLQICSISCTNESNAADITTKEDVSISVVEFENILNSMNFYKASAFKAPNVTEKLSRPIVPGKSVNIIGEASDSEMVHVLTTEVSLKKFFKFSLKSLTENVASDAEKLTDEILKIPLRVALNEVSVTKSVAVVEELLQRNFTIVQKEEKMAISVLPKSSRTATLEWGILFCENDKFESFVIAVPAGKSVENIVGEVASAFNSGNPSLFVCRCFELMGNDADTASTKASGLLLEVQKYKFDLMQSKFIKKLASEESPFKPKHFAQESVLKKMFVKFENIPKYVDETDSIASLLKCFKYCASLIAPFPKGYNLWADLFYKTASHNWPKEGFENFLKSTKEMIFAKREFNLILGEFLKKKFTKIKFDNLVGESEKFTRQDRSIHLDETKTQVRFVQLPVHPQDRTAYDKVKRFVAKARVNFTTNYMDNKAASEDLFDELQNSSFDSYLTFLESSRSVSTAKSSPRLVEESSSGLRSKSDKLPKSRQSKSCNRGFIIAGIIVLVLIAVIVTGWCGRKYYLRCRERAEL